MLDHVELPLGLATGFLHAEELAFDIGADPHVPLPRHPMKLDGPS